MMKRKFLIGFVLKIPPLSISPAKIATIAAVWPGCDILQSTLRSNTHFLNHYLPKDQSTRMYPLNLIVMLKLMPCQVIQNYTCRPTSIQLLTYIIIYFECRIIFYGEATAEQKNLTAINFWVHVCVDCNTFTALKVQCSQRVYVVKFPKFIILEIKIL